MMTAIEIKVPSNPRLLKVVRCGVQHLCDICGFSGEVRHSITLAVDEAIANIIRHAYQERDDQPISVRCRLFDDRLEIILEDQGEAAEAGKMKSRDLEDIRPGGLGIHLIQSTMDVVDYQRSSEGVNQLKLVKYLASRNDKDA